MTGAIAKQIYRYLVKNDYTDDTDQIAATYHEAMVLAQRGWQALRQVSALIGGLPRDLARLLRTARKGRIQVQIDITELRSVGDQLERAAQRIAVSLVIAALIVGSSIVMTVGGGPTLLGLPAFGLLGFVGATVGALWLLFGGRK